MSNTYQTKHYYLLGPLEDARFTVYEDEREVNIAYVSSCGLQYKDNQMTIHEGQMMHSNHRDFILST